MLKRNRLARRSVSQVNRDRFRSSGLMLPNRCQIVSHQPNCLGFGRDLKNCWISEISFFRHVSFALCLTRQCFFTKLSKPSCSNLVRNNLCLEWLLDVRLSKLLPRRRYATRRIIGYMKYFMIGYFIFLKVVDVFLFEVQMCR